MSRSLFLSICFPPFDLTKTISQSEINRYLLYNETVTHESITPLSIPLEIWHESHRIPANKLI